MLGARRSRSWAYNAPQRSAARLCSGKASTTNPFAAAAAKKAAAASSTASTTNPFAAAAAKKAAAKPAKKTWQPLKLTEKRRESDTITSFVFVHTDGSAPISYEAGQYFPIRLSVPGVKSPVVRTYTLSDMSNAKAYRISVKREARKLCEH